MYIKIIYPNHSEKTFDCKTYLIAYAEVGSPKLYLDQCSENECVEVLTGCMMYVMNSEGKTIDAKKF